RERTSGGEERLERARREMGLAEAAEDDEDDGELPFELGPERLPELPRDVDPEAPPFAEGLAHVAYALSLARPDPERDLDRAGAHERRRGAPRAGAPRDGARRGGRGRRGRRRAALRARPRAAAGAPARRRSRGSALRRGARARRVRALARAPGPGARSRSR